MEALDLLPVSVTGEDGSDRLPSANSSQQTGYDHTTGYSERRRTVNRDLHVLRKRRNAKR